MLHPIRSVAAPLTAALLLTACGSQSIGEPVRPLTPEEQARIDSLREAETNLGRIEDESLLFLTLDQNLRTWRELHLKGAQRERMQLRSLEVALSRLVYNNFDTLLAALGNDGNEDHRAIAAGGIGFARFPDAVAAPPPPVHEQAVAPLVALLETDDDVLTQNALVSLTRLASPDTPVALILEMAVSHHNANVRANAALVLSRVLRPEHRTLATSSLYVALEDPEPKVRLHAVTALGALQDEDAVGQLIGVLSEDSTPLVQANAARVLGQFSNLASMPYLAQGLTHDSPVVRVSCHQSLQQLVGKDLGIRSDAWMAWYREHRTS